MNDNRRRCPICRASTIVRKDGTFRKHMRVQKGRWHMVPCEGSEQPAPATD